MHREYNTTLRTDRELLNKIAGLKKHPREAYSDVIDRLVSREIKAKKRLQSKKDGK